MTAHTELEGRPVTLNEEGNDHVESLQAEARQADEAAPGEDGLTRAADGDIDLHEHRRRYHREKAVEFAVDVYRADPSIGLSNIGTIVNEFYLFLQGKMIYGEADHEA